MKEPFIPKPESEEAPKTSASVDPSKDEMHDKNRPQQSEQSHSPESTSAKIKIWLREEGEKEANDDIWYCAL